MSKDTVKEDKKKKVIDAINQTLNPCKEDLIKIIDEIYQDDQKNHFLRLFLIFARMFTFSNVYFIDATISFSPKNFSLDSFTVQKLFSAVQKNNLSLCIDHFDDASIADHHHGIGSCFHNLAETKISALAILNVYMPNRTFFT